MRSRRWLLTAGIVVAAVFLSAVLLRQPLGRLVLRRALGALGTALRGQVSYEKVGGDVFGHPRLYGLRVVAEQDSILLDSIDLRYDLPGMLRGRFSFSEVTAWRPRVYAATKRPPAGEGGQPKEKRLPNVSIGGLRIAGGQVWFDTALRADAVNLSLRLESRPRRLEAALSSLQLRLVRESLDVRRLSARCRLASDSLWLTGLELRTERSLMRAALTLSLSDMGVRARVESLSVSLPEVLRAAGMDTLPGRASLRGSGTLGDSTVSVQAGYAASGFEMGGTTLPEVSGTLTLDRSLLEFSAAGEDTAFGKVAIEASVDLRRHSYTGRMELGRIAVQKLLPRLPDFRADVVVDASGVKTDSVVFAVQAGSRELGVDSLRASGTYVRGSLVLTALRASGRSGKLHGSGRLHRAGIDGESEFEDVDAALIGRFIGQEWSGRGSGTLRGHFEPDSVAVAGEVGIQAGSGFGVRMSQALARFDLALGRAVSGVVVAGAESIAVAGMVADAVQLTLDQDTFGLRVDLPRNRLLADGTVRLGRSGMDLRATRMEFATMQETMTVMQPFDVVLRPETLQVSGLATTVAGGTLSLDLAAVGNRPAEIRFSATQVDLGQLGELVQLPESLSGSVDLSVTGSETLDIDLRASRLAMPSISMALSGAGATLSATRRQVVIRRGWFVSGGRAAAGDTSSISGTIGFRTDSGFAVEHLGLDVALRDPGSWVFFFLRPTFELEAGQVFGDIRLSGEAAQPDMRGRVRVSQGRLHLPDLSATVERLGAELTFARGRIGLQKIAGRSGKGSVVATGLVDMRRNWLVDSVACDVELSGASLSPQPEVLAVVDGNLHIGWSPIRALAVAGDVNVSEGLLALGFGEPSAPGAGPDTMVRFDVRVRGERGIWLRNQIADIELGVDLLVRKTGGEMVYSGELVSRQGAVYYLDHTLRVTSGRLGFENIDRFNPDLDIVAEMPIHAASDSGAGTPEKVLITLGGTLEQPVFDFRTEPEGWSTEEIVSYLNFNVTPGELSAMDQREAVTRLLSQRLLGFFQTQVSKRARGFVNLDYLQFESGWLTGTNTKVTVGKYIGRNLYVSYTQSFTGDLQPVFRVEYFLNRKNELVGERTDDGRYALRYRFRLRY